MQVADLGRGAVELHVGLDFNLELLRDVDALVRLGLAVIERRLLLALLRHLALSVFHLPLLVVVGPCSSVAKGLALGAFSSLAQYFVGFVQS